MAVKFTSTMLVDVNHMQIFSLPVLCVDDCVGSSLDEGGATKQSDMFEILDCSMACDIWEMLFLDVEFFLATSGNREIYIKNNSHCL